MLLRLTLPQEGEPVLLSGSVAERLLGEAGRLGVLPTVARNLGRIDLAGVRAVTARNLLLKQERARLLRLLEDAGIRARAVKGIELAERLYPDLSWRQIEDIDLIVDAGRVEQAFELLCSAGLVPNHNWNAAGLRRQLRRTLRLAPELVFSGPNGLVVELHWDWPGGALPAGGLFDQPEHYLVYLCRHAGKHFWSFLKWLCDIELFQRQLGKTLDWTLFWRLAVSSGAESSCLVSLELCRRWFGSGAAPGLETRLTPKIRRLADRAEAEMLNPAASPSHAVWNQLRLARWRDWPEMLRAWWSPQPQEWNRAQERGWPGWRTRLERWRHLWLRWTPLRASKLSAEEWGFLVEAYGALATINVARRLVSSARLCRSVGREPANGHSSTWTLEKLQRAAWLLDVAAMRQPVAVSCLTRSLALAWLLRRRGAGVALHIGVKRQDDGVAGHAWLEWRGEVLYDPSGEATQYAALAGLPG